MTTSSAGEFALILTTPAREVLNTALRVAFLASTALGTVAGTTSVASVPEIANVRFVGTSGTSSGRMAELGQLEEVSQLEAEQVGDDFSVSLLDPMAIAVADQVEMVRWIHDASGLTWDQISKLLGVSRRSVHLWANGGRMNGSNAESLNDLVALLRTAPPGTPDQRRAFLLSPDAEGRSVLDHFRAKRASSSQSINSSTFTPDQLIGAIHDDDNREWT